MKKSSVWWVNVISSFFLILMFGAIFITSINIMGFMWINLLIPITCLRFIYTNEIKETKNIEDRFIFKNKIFVWEKGRQERVEYYKMRIYSFKIFKRGFDCYILKYPQETALPQHKDPVENGKHWRINISLYGKSVFYIENKGISRSRINIFRPDLYLHSLYAYTKVIKLSLGFVKFN